MNKKYFFIGLGVIILALLGFIGYQNNSESETTTNADKTTPKPQEMVIKTDPKSDPRLIGIQEYVTSNISNLSPTKEGQGTTFQVTNISVEKESGVVSYTDGKNSYTADFKYSVDPVYKNWIITAFSIRK